MLLNLLMPVHVTLLALPKNDLVRTLSLNSFLTEFNWAFPLS